MSKKTVNISPKKHPTIVSPIRYLHLSDRCARATVDHSILTLQAANWGWYDSIIFLITFVLTHLLPSTRAQFARRDSVYYQSLSAKTQDAFVIACSITSSPSPLSIHSPGHTLSVPKLLIDTVGSLLDDPRYSDVEFVILRRNQDPKKARRIWASRKLLQRAEHFDDSTRNHPWCFASC